VKADPELVEALIAYAESGQAGEVPAALANWIESREFDGSLLGDWDEHFTWVSHEAAESALEPPSSIEWSSLEGVLAEDRVEALETGAKPTRAESDLLAKCWAEGILGDDGDGDYTAIIHRLTDDSDREALILFRMSGGGWGTVECELVGVFASWGSLLGFVSQAGYHNLIIPESPSR